MIPTTPVNKGFGFLFEMGCGKTLTAIAVAGAGYQKVFNGLTSQGNTVLKRLRKVIDSDKDRWRRYQKEKAEAAPKPPSKATGGEQHTPPPPPWPPNA